MEQQNQSKPANSLDESADNSKALDSEPGTNDSGAAATSETNLATPTAKPTKKANPLKQFLKKFNLYFLIFVFICIIAAIVTIVSYLNSKKAAPAPLIATQQLNQDTLKQLVNADATVGGSGQTLTVQGNAIFAGQVLTKSDLGVAGSIVTNNIKVGTEITVPQMTVTAKSNLNDTQITGLQVSGSTTMQGSLTLQRDLNVAGTSSFNGPVTMNTLNVSQINMAGTAVFNVPNHMSFSSGPTPGRSVNPSVLGAGGTSTLSGSDTSGTINVNTGANPTPGCFARLTFSQKFATAPRIIVSPVGAGAGQTQYYVTKDANGFSICTANAAPANQVFSYDYFISQ